MFNTAYIGLFDRSLLPMSLIQVESALKQATSKSRTPVSMYQFDPIGIVYEKKLKLPTHRFFLFFSIMERIRKGSDLPKKKWGHRASNKNIGKPSYRKSHQLYILLSFDSVRALEIHDVARATLSIACALEMRSSNGRERP